MGRKKINHDTDVVGFRVEKSLHEIIKKVCLEEDLAETVFYRKAVKYFLENALKIKSEEKKGSKIFLNNF